METPEKPVTTLLHDLAISAKDLVKNEMKLLELKTEAIADDVSSRLKLLVFAGSLAVLSLGPLVAAGIIALGNYLQNYWLSALIIGLALAAISMTLLSWVLKKINLRAEANDSASLEVTSAIQEIGKKTYQVKNAVEGV